MLVQPNEIKMGILKIGSMDCVLKILPFGSLSTMYVFPKINPKQKKNCQDSKKILHFQ